MTEHAASAVAVNTGATCARGQVRAGRINHAANAYLPLPACVLPRLRAPYASSLSMSRSMVEGDHPCPLPSIDRLLSDVSVLHVLPPPTPGPRSDHRGLDAPALEDWARTPFSSQHHRRGSSQSIEADRRAQSVAKASRPPNPRPNPGSTVHPPQRSALGRVLGRDRCRTRRPRADARISP
jgi:hypothetical protein